VFKIQCSGSKTGVENETKRNGISGIFSETKWNETKNNWENEKRNDIQINETETKK
jgi:hypothetical protein